MPEKNERDYLMTGGLISGLISSGYIVSAAFFGIIFEDANKFVHMFFGLGVGLVFSIFIRMRYLIFGFLGNFGILLLLLAFMGWDKPIMLGAISLLFMTFGGTAALFIKILVKSFYKAVISGVIKNSKTPR